MSNYYTIDKTTQSYFESGIPPFALDLSRMPTNLSEVREGVTFGHPFALIIPSPLTDYIYPSWFTEGKGEYSLLDQEKIGGRETWVIEYKAWFERELSTYLRVWVDQETGVILKFVQYNLNKEWVSDLFVEAALTSIVVDAPISLEKFSVPENYQPTTKRP